MSRNTMMRVMKEQEKVSFDAPVFTDTFNQFNLVPFMNDYEVGAVEHRIEF